MFIPRLEPGFLRSVNRDLILLQCSRFDDKHHHILLQKSRVASKIYTLNLPASGMW